MTEPNQEYQEEIELLFEAAKQIARKRQGDPRRMAHCFRALSLIFDAIVYLRGDGGAE